MRKNASNARTTVRLSVSVDVGTHAKLAAIAALRGQDRAAIAGAILKAGLKHVVVRDGPEPDQVEKPDESSA